MASLDENKIKEVISVCESMLSKAYCVYSRFPVSSVIITECGKQFTGVNVENSSFGLCICAERTAAVKAVSEGFKRFKYCFVMTNSDQVIAPCGACRQFLAEFAVDMELFLSNKNRRVVVKTLKELLPLAFTQKELESGIIRKLWRHKTKPNKEVAG